VHWNFDARDCDESSWIWESVSGDLFSGGMFCSCVMDVKDFPMVVISHRLLCWINDDIPNIVITFLYVKLY
jgi:hypothetical protein